MVKKISLTVLALLLVAVAGVLAYALTRPDDFRVQRSAIIKAPPERLYALIADFHQWSGWSPYEKLDPAMQRRYSGAERGAGAVYSWDGNNKVGSGRMEILEAVPASRIRIKLDFVRPFEGHNMAEFTLVPQADGTGVTWAMSGPAPFVAKVMGAFVNMDALIGKDFETGLGNLKLAAEK